MYNDEQFEALEQEELEITDEAIVLMFRVLSGLKTDIEHELRAFYQKYGRDGIVTYAEARKWISEKNHQRRLTALLLIVGGSFLYTFDYLETHFRKFLTDVIGKESTFFSVKVDVDKVLTRKWGVDDLYWLERLDADVNLWQNHIANDIKQALHQGKRLDDVLKKLDKRFKSINSVLETLGISESTAVGSLARQSIFKELGITKYQFYTQVDERRCETCGALHGVIFPISSFEVGVTASPLHPRCRCWEVPIME